MTAIPHTHVRTRSLARHIPAWLLRLAIRLHLDEGLFWATEPHHPDCTDEIAVLEVRS